MYSTPKKKIYWDAHFFNLIRTEQSGEHVFLFYVFLLLALIHNTMIQVWESFRNWDNTKYTTQRSISPHSILNAHSLLHKTVDDTEGRASLTIENWHWQIILTKGKGCTVWDGKTQKTLIIGKFYWEKEGLSTKNIRCHKLQKDNIPHSRTHYKHSQPQQQEATCRPLRPGISSRWYNIWIEQPPSKHNRIKALESDLRMCSSGWCWGWGRSPRPRERSLDLLLCLCDCHLRPPSRSSGCQVNSIITYVM